MVMGPSDAMGVALIPSKFLSLYEEEKEEEEEEEEKDKKKKKKKKKRT